MSSSAVPTSSSMFEDGGNPQENSGRYPSHSKDGSSQGKQQLQQSSTLQQPPGAPASSPPKSILHNHLQYSTQQRQTTPVVSPNIDIGCDGSDDAVQTPVREPNKVAFLGHVGVDANPIGTNPQSASPSASEREGLRRSGWDNFLFGNNANQAVEKLSQVIDQACTTNPCSRDDSMDDSDPPDFLNRNVLDISSLFPPEATATATDLQHKAANWFAAAANSMRKIPNGSDDGSVQGTSSALERRLQRHDKRTVTSRMHEEIEVSPHHHIQVRLPPTNPVIASGAEQNLVLQQQQQQQQQITLKPAAAEPFSPAKTSPTPSARATKDGQSVGIIGSVRFAIPFEVLEVKSDEAAELERSISELTMRSSYAATDGALKKIPENRRMAYYAVGKHHRQSVQGGNRRCYFTGKLIFNNMPFYAGCVLQGLRTLVVFCLPSAVGLPDREQLLKHQTTVGRHDRTSSLSTMGSSLASLKGLRLLGRAGISGGSKHSHHSSGASSSHNLVGGSLRDPPPMDHRSSPPLARKKNRSSSASIANASHASKVSRLSSLDDLSLSIEGDLDPNWSLDRDFLLSLLPPASPDLLQQMATLYPDQFETLPVPVRDAKMWKLFVKFCFFSGLPISEGEMHYKVRDEIADAVYGEEIILSHDVLEASTGASSAEILTLPNRTVLRYLRKHYAQQCSKLDYRIFQRASWERIAPEV